MLPPPPAIVCSVAPDTATALADLKSRDRGTWEEAAIQLAHLGAAALPALDAAAKDADLADRVKTTVCLMLLFTISPDELQGHPNLVALCKQDLDDAERVAMGFKDRTCASWGGGLGPEGSEPMGDEELLRELAAQSGFAVPAAVHLCTSDSPVARAYGVNLLGRVRATGQAALLEKLQADTATVRLALDDTIRRSTVGSLASDQLRFTVFRCCVLPKPNDCRACYEPEWFIEAIDPVPSEMINSLRTDAHTFDAASWDDFWLRARPLFRELAARPIQKPR
jgi:hypothetical protein